MPERQIIVNTVKSTVETLGYKTRPGDSLTAQGFLIKNPPPELKGLWLGTLAAEKSGGIFVSAFPCAKVAVNKLLDEDFEFNKEHKLYWLQKELFSRKEIIKLAKLPAKEQKEIIKNKITQTYPFSSPDK